MIGLLTSSSAGDGTKGIVNKINKLIVIDITSTDNNHVVTEVISSFEAGNIINSEVLDLVGLTFDGLAEHVVTERIEVCVFKGGIHQIVHGGVMLTSNSLLDNLKISGIKA